MLGTNDTKSTLERTSAQIGIGMSVLVEQLLTPSHLGTLYPAPEVLVIAPPPLTSLTDPWSDMLFAGAREKTAELAKVYALLVRSLGVAFFDAASVISTDGIDGLHLTEKNNRDLGQALAEEVRRLLGDE